MGALTLNRRRVDECFSSYNSPSPQSSIRITHTSINSLNHNPCYSSSNQFYTHLSKKPRICYNSLDQVSEEGSKVLQTQQSIVHRLQKYPKPGKLRREVHAPCSRPRRFPFSSSLSFGFRCGVSERATAGEAEEMGNGTSSVLWRQYEKTRNKALGSFRFFKVREEEERFVDLEADRRKEVVVVSEDSSEVEILDEGNEVRSEEGRGVGSKGLGSVLESQWLDGRPTENSVLDGKLVQRSASMSREAYLELMSSVDRTYSHKLSCLGSDIQYYEAKRSSFPPLKSSKRKEEERQLQELKKAEEDLLREPFLPLTEEEKYEVKQALTDDNRRRVLVTHENSNIQITVEMLQCLRPGTWLNDEVINVYLELLKERERREPKRFLNCHFFNTFFYKKLIAGRNGYDYKSVRRWTSQRKLGYKLVDCDKIFVPIHKEVHWCLAVINKKDETFQYLDSLGGRDSRIFGVLADYYVDEVKDKCGQDIDVSNWGREFVDDLPEQQNGYDCGVFMVKYTDFYSRGMGLYFSQEHMPYFRQRIAKEILKLRAD